MKRRYLFMAMLVIGVGALAGTLWFAVGVWPATGQGQQPSDPLAEAQIAQPDDSGTANASIVTRGTIVELVQASDIVIVGTVVSQADQTSSAVSEYVVAVRANYTLEPERYLKGGGGTSLEFALTVARNRKDERGEGTTFVQSADPLTVGARYIFFLRETADGRVTLVAEPGRFRIVDAVARVESTIRSGGDDGMDFSDTFPARSMADLIEEVVRAAALPTPVPPTPEPPHEDAPHEDDF